MSSIIGQIELEHTELFALESDSVYTLSSTNIDQSAPNFVKTYVIIRYQMSSVMDLIGPELSELSALELESAIFDFVYTLAPANINQSVPNLATIYLLIMSRMSSIMEQIKLEHPELFALEFGKIAETDFVYTLASPNINQSALNLVKMYVTIRSWMSSIIDLIGAELSDLFALEFAKTAESDFVYTLACTNVDQCAPNTVTIYMTMRSWMSSIMGQIQQ